MMEKIKKENEYFKPVDEEDARHMKKEADKRKKKAEKELLKK